MYIYNVTFSVDKEIIDDFLSFIKAEFIPSSLECDGFSHPILSRVLHDLDPKSSNHALQFHVEAVNDINLWYEDKGSLLFSTIMDKWGERVVFFQTVLEVLHD